MATLTDDQLDQIAKEGDALNRVNTILGRNPTPGIGMPGSTPQTDAGNISMASAMERSDRGNRFGFNSVQYAQNSDVPEVATPVDPVIGQLKTRQQQLLSGTDPDKPAIYPNDKRRAEMRQELYHLTGILEQHTLGDAHLATEHYKQLRNIQAAEEHTALIKGLSEMKTTPGTPEHAQELLGLVHQYPLGSQSKSALLLLKALATTHAEQKTLRDRISEFSDATGLAPESVETTATGGVNIRGKTKDTADKVPSHTLDRYAKLQGEIALHEATSKKEEEENIAAKQSDVPYSKSAELSAAQKELSILEKAHPELKDAVQKTEAPTQFDTEEAARTAGHKKGDIVMMKNPKTGKYQRARLE